MPPQFLTDLQSALARRENRELAALAARSADAVRRRLEPRLQTDYRPGFAVDADRILHSQAYTRYIDKTQVFALVRDDHITHRVLHVQLVSKIARTIGRFLRLNEDLIEAIALGHDIGHPPFGHDGERILSEWCRRQGIGPFLHNVQSIQFLERVERHGKGWNLSLQTLDGIVGHNGEVHDRRLAPRRNKDFSDHEAELALLADDPDHPIRPMTMEGCVVRMADTIAYIGRDIEDAIRLDLIQREDLPDDCMAVLGDTNGTIVYRLVTDLILNSRRKAYVAFSPEISEALRRLKAFNLERIYLNPTIKAHLPAVRCMYAHLMDRYLDDLTAGREDSPIVASFLREMSPTYTERHRPAEIVRDFIAGMTDRYFVRACPESMQRDCGFDR